MDADLGNYTCECPLGFTGRNCESLPSLCDDNLCTNGGTCLQGPSGYLCVCPPGDFDEKNNCKKFTGCHQSPCRNGKKQLLSGKSVESLFFTTLQGPVVLREWEADAQHKTLLLLHRLLHRLLLCFNKRLRNRSRFWMRASFSFWFLRRKTDVLRAVVLVLLNGCPSLHPLWICTLND